MLTPWYHRMNLQISQSYMVCFCYLTYGQRYYFYSGASHSFITVSCVEELGFEVETLEKPLYVSSSLGTRGSVQRICRNCELEISEILLTVDLRVMDITDFDVILRMDWLMAHRVVIDYDRRELLPTHEMESTLCFRGISTRIYPRLCMTPRGTDN